VDVKTGKERWLEGNILKCENCRVRNCVHNSQRLALCKLCIRCIWYTCTSLLDGHL